MRPEALAPGLDDKVEAGKSEPKNIRVYYRAPFQLSPDSIVGPRWLVKVASPKLQQAGSGGEFWCSGPREETVRNKRELARTTTGLLLFLTAS
jgi:hypothetical protein